MFLLGVLHAVVPWLLLSLKKKAEAIDREVPLQPMNLFMEMESRDHEEFHAGIDN